MFSAYVSRKQIPHYHMMGDCIGFDCRNWPHGAKLSLGSSPVTYVGVDRIRAAGWLCYD